MKRFLSEEDFFDQDNSHVIGESTQEFLEADDNEVIGEATQGFLEIEDSEISETQLCFLEADENFISERDQDIIEDFYRRHNLYGEGSSANTDTDFSECIHFRIKGKKLNRKFNVEESVFEVKIDKEKIPNGITGITLNTITRLNECLFQRLIDITSRGLELSDMIRFCIFSESLDKPISTCITKVSEFNVEKIIGAITKVLQSKDEIPLDETFEVNVITLRKTIGAGRMSMYNIDTDKVKKRSVVTIPYTEDNLCCARAIIVGMAYLKNDPRLKTIRDERCNLPKNLAIQLHEATNVEKGPCGLSEIKIFEQHLDIQIIVVSSHQFNKIIYKGPNKDDKIYLYHHNNHYDVIRSMNGFHGKKLYCLECDKAFDHQKNHSCSFRCKICFSADCVEADCVDTYCRNCNRVCKSKACFDRHNSFTSKQILSICERFYECRYCHRLLESTKEPKARHRCGHYVCSVCKKYTDIRNHHCFMKQEKPKTPSDSLIFFDLETDQTNGEHVVNFAVAQYRNGQENVFSGYDAIDKFCRFLFRPQHKNYTVIAHNLKGFDGQFLVNWIIKQGRKPKIVPCGSKLMKIEYMGITLIDSFNFLPMSLTKLPKTFGLTELKKGFFPHKFNTPENQDYVGILPEVKFFDPDMMSPASREEFFLWYEERSKLPFDFKKEMYEYCRSDVDILRRCCIQFQDEFKLVAKVDPFRYTTIASACMGTFKAYHIQENSIGVIPNHGYVSRCNFSRDSIRWLEYLSQSRNIRIKHALNGSGEQRIAGHYVDGYYDEEKTVFMYHGCFYHGCPSCFDSDAINPLTKMSMSQMYEKTTKTKEEIMQAGFRYEEIWEHDFKEMKKNEDVKAILETLDIQDRLDPRDSFYGGRTNAIRLYFEGDAKYYDFTSLYPWVNKYCLYPSGHPQIITKDFGDINNYFGIIKCQIIPPRGLFHPVLPFRCNGKLTFPLCQKCVSENQKEDCTHTDSQRALTGTWVSEEIKKATSKGYVIKQIYEVYHFERSTKDLFKSYINLFLKIKQESSGWPDHCTTVEEKERYIAEYMRKESVHLDYSAIDKNPGRRQVAKLALNSFWGRWGMKSNKNQISYVADIAEFNKIINDPTKEIKDLYLATSEVIGIQWCYKDVFQPHDVQTNVFLASFTTCYARLRLYEELEKLGDKVLYFDTDSIIFSCTGTSLPPLGDYLGELTDELNGETIKKFVSGGPKSYAFVTDKGSETCKIKGFTLNYRNSLVLNRNSVQELLLSRDWNESFKIINESKITRDGKKRRVLNRKEIKNYKIVYDKRRLHEDFSTTPFGF